MFDGEVRDTVEPRAPADDGGCRCVRARVCVDGLRLWRASHCPTTAREPALAASETAARGGCDLL